MVQKFQRCVSSGSGRDISVRNWDDDDRVDAVDSIREEVGERVSAVKRGIGGDWRITIDSAFVMAYGFL